jgi:ABC-type transporter Mla subunit MlaD
MFRCIRDHIRFFIGTEPLARLLSRLIHRISTLEELMANATEQLTALSSKVDDLISDVRAALDTINDDQLSPQAQEALDGLSAKVAAFDTEVGDADGSDVPVEPTVPADEDTTQF